MTRKVECPAGQWTVIFNHAFVQMPHTWTISFTATDGTAVEGEVEEQCTLWIIPQPPTTYTLTGRMVFRRGWWNTFYSVRVKPMGNVIAEIS